MQTRSEIVADWRELAKYSLLATAMGILTASMTVLLAF